MRAASPWPWLAALAVALVCALPALAQTHEQATHAQVKHYRTGIAWHRTQAWHWQDVAHVHRTRTAHYELHTRSDGYLRWLARLWSHRRVQARTAAAAYLRHQAAVRRAHTLPYTGDWVTAVAVMQRAYPGSAAWLLACSSSEGGHGGFVWRGHTSEPDSGPNTTPGGWMQYMAGTWAGDYRAAVADLAARGWHVPAGLNYYTPLGQAVAAAWAYGHSRPAGKWTGGRC